jgi:hypothetical protein
MTALRRFLLLAPYLALAACEPMVIIERDEIDTIPSGARWAWSVPDDDGLSPEDGDVTPTESVALAISQAITDELETRGYRLTTADSAQFFVHYHLGVHERVDTLPPANPPRAVGDRDPRGWGAYGDPEQMRSNTMTWQEGMLFVDAITPDGKKVSWRGVLVGEIKPEAEANPAPVIRAGINKLFAQFP